MSTRTPPGRRPAVEVRESGWTTVDVADAGPMRLFVARPASPGPHPGLIVCQEAFGVNEHIRDVTTRFAGQGFVAVAPELYHRTGTGVDGRYDDFPGMQPHFSKLTNDGMAADVHAAYDWLAVEQGVDLKRVAAIGYCMGGRAAFLANAELPLRASVSYYGGGIAPQLLDRASDLHGPQLMFWGGLDTHIPPEQHRTIDDALRAAGKAYTTVEFGEGDHGFFCDARPAFNPDVAAEAWALTIAFFRRTLGLATTLD
jgi:carboxymethylenebutenolidase